MPATFSSLPTEIHKLIVTLASKQDSDYRSSKKRDQRKKLLGAASAFIDQKGWKQYGNSLTSLSATCSQLRVLAKPLIFETLPLSKSNSAAFHYFVKPQNSSSFQTIEVDDLGHWLTEEKERLAKSHILDFFVSTFPLLTNVFEISLTSNFTTKMIFDALPQLDECSWNHWDTIEQAKAKQAARGLSNSIFTIIVDPTLISAFPIQARFGSVERVIFTGGLYREWDKFDFDLRTVPGLLSLKVDFDLPGSVSDHILPASWTESKWVSQTSLTSLMLSFTSIYNSEWQFVLLFATSLTYLSINFNEWKVDLPGGKNALPSLKHLELFVETSNTAVAILDQLAPPSKLSKITLHLWDEEGVEDNTYKEMFTSLTSIVSSEILLQISLSYADEGQLVSKEFASFVESMPKGCVARLYPQQPGGWEKINWAYKFPGKLKESFLTSEVLAFVDEIRAKVEQAERVGDESAVGEIVRWLEPLLAKTVLDME